MIGIWKKIQFFKTSFNNKNSISFSHIKFILTLIFAPKMMEFWSFFQFCFWGPLKLLRPLKKAQTLDSWPLTMPSKTRPWIRLVLKKCPVSREETIWGNTVKRCAKQCKNTNAWHPCCFDYLIKCVFLIALLNCIWHNTTGPCDMESWWY